jgi:16S rRNA (guanine(1405)-N(7))-methyltransferase
MAERRDAVAEAIRQSRKYRHLCPEVVLRMAEWAITRTRSQKEAVKTAKRKLHQVCGAYLGHWESSALDDLLAQMPQGRDMELLKPACRAIMQRHTSTSERLEFLPGLFESLFRITGVPSRVLDLGCGLHPFALPWMGLPGDVKYAAWDIDARCVALVNAFLRRIGLEPLAEWRDVLGDGPKPPADVAFLLKTLPCLEQQQKGCGARLLREISAPFVVASFPARSMGGREKGMRGQYTAALAEMLHGTSWRSTLVERGQELFFVVEKA